MVAHCCRVRRIWSSVSYKGPCLLLQEEEALSSGMGELRQQVQRLEEELLDASRRLMAADAQRQAERWEALGCLHPGCKTPTAHPRVSTYVLHGSGGMKHQYEVLVGFLGWQGALRRSPGSPVGTACPVRQPCSRGPVPVTLPHGVAL